MQIKINYNKALKYAQLSNKVMLAAKAAKTKEAADKLSRLWMYYFDLSLFYNSGRLDHLENAAIMMNVRIRQWHCYKGVN
jgi:hypothetical protein